MFLLVGQFHFGTPYCCGFETFEAQLSKQQRQEGDLPGQQGPLQILRRFVRLEMKLGRSAMGHAQALKMFRGRFGGFFIKT